MVLPTTRSKSVMVTVILGSDSRQVNESANPRGLKMNHCGAEEQAIIEEEPDSAARLVLRSVEVYERNQLCRQKRLASPGCMQRFLSHGARRVPLNGCSRNLGGVHLRRPPRLEARLQHSCSTVVAEQAYCAYCGPNTGLYVRRHLLTCKAVGLSEVFHQHDIRNPDFVLNIQNGLFIGRY